ncbi:MAG: hypothetical protein ABI693_28440 [Bryobacteraceae bacterium]
MKTLILRTCVVTALALAIGPLMRAAENNYYVHFTATNSSPGWIAAGSLNATPLAVPAGACGMVFEQVDDKSFILPYDIEGPELPAGNIEILIGTCNGGGVSIDHIDMPSGWDGAIEIDDAYGYWVDGNHNKLIYKHSCGGSCSPDFGLYGGHGWHFVPELLIEMKASMAGQKGIRSLDVLVQMSGRYMQQLSRDLSTAVIARRGFTTGVLETSVRAQEDDAQAHLASASSLLRSATASRSRGDLKSASSFADRALIELNLSAAALDAAQVWISLEQR